MAKEQTWKKLTPAQLKRAESSAEEMFDLLQEVLDYGVPRFNGRIRDLLFSIATSPTSPRGSHD